MKPSELFKTLPLPRWVSLTITICVGCLIALEAGATFLGLPYTSYEDLVEICLVGALVALTGRWPAYGALAFLVASLFSLAWMEPALFRITTIPMAALVARTCSWQFGVLASCLTGLWAVILGLTGDTMWFDGVTLIFFVVLGTGLGLSIRLAALRNLRLSQEVRLQEEAREKAVTAERKRIAAELHDVVAHDLTIIAMQARVLDTATEPEDRLEARQAIGDASRQALKDMRRMLGILYGPDTAANVAEAEETTGGLRLRVHEFAGLLKAQGARVEVDMPADLEVPRSLELTLIRIAQEATTNILKHALGTPSVQYVVETGENSITLSVTNSRAIRRAHTEFPSSGFGLVGLRERVTVYGGAIESGPTAEGWMVRATFATTNA
ncbi:histidine kinase [Rothia sp. AR01]|uniref:histidine kinase n=1 Tax=Rothia santali TaxID=2949643 RepID=A0A9X2HIR5_9MICC|nr:histidine kinase [Rothia santali]MCP3424993.1 histidine kinase [Rothia santali]